MTIIRWSLKHLCLEYDVDLLTLFPARREKYAILFVENLLKNSLPIIKTAIYF